MKSQSKNLSTLSRSRIKKRLEII